MKAEERDPPGRAEERQAELREGLVAEAIEPFEGQVPRDVMVEVEAALVELLAAHPDGARLVRQLLPDPHVERSGEVGEPWESVQARRASRKNGA